MARCENCIHYVVCKTEEWFTEGFDNPKCPYFYTADVLPKSEVACELVGLYEKCASKIPHHIRRIFKDDRNFEDGFREGKTDALIEVLALIAELKKKYTEEAE